MVKVIKYTSSPTNVLYLQDVVMQDFENNYPKVNVTGTLRETIQRWTN